MEVTGAIIRSAISQNVGGVLILLPEKWTEATREASGAWLDSAPKRLDLLGWSYRVPFFSSPLRLLRKLARGFDEALQEIMNDVRSCLISFRKEMA